MSKNSQKALTPTSYAILGLLCLRPFSAYELARQMTRGLALIWPRAASAIYEEPKNLVAHGLAAVVVVRQGRRSKSLYSSTAAGKRALRAWVGGESSRSRYESEAHLRIFFAEFGSKDDALSTLARLGQEAAETRVRLVAQIRGLLEGQAPFPDRAHIVSVGARFLIEQAAHTESWTKWAAEQVSRWPSTGAGAASRGEKIFKQLLAEYDRD